MGTLDILNNISEYVTLLKILDSPGNVKHAVSVVGKCIFDSNNEKYLTLTIESLNLIFLVIMKVNNLPYSKNCLMQ